MCAVRDCTPYGEQGPNLHPWRTTRPHEARTSEGVIGIGLVRSCRAPLKRDASSLPNHAAEDYSVLYSYECSPTVVAALSDSKKSPAKHACSYLEVFLLCCLYRGPGAWLPSVQGRDLHQLSTRVQQVYNSYSIEYEY